MKQVEAPQGWTLLLSVSSGNSGTYALFLKDKENCILQASWRIQSSWSLLDPLNIIQVVKYTCLACGLVYPVSVSKLFPMILQS